MFRATTYFVSQDKIRFEAQVHQVILNPDSPTLFPIEKDLTGEFFRRLVLPYLLIEHLVTSVSPRS